MASSRRRFLMSAAAMGGAALGGRVTAWHGAAAPPESPPGSFSPSELLERHERETVAAAGSAAPAAEQSDPRMPTQAEVDSWYTDRRNWGRWGTDDQKGAINLITSEKRTAAAALVRTGRTVSMSRVFEPTQHFMRKNPRGDTGAASVVDYYGFIYHGQTVTHIDAMCHMWDTDGMWQGRDPDVEVNTRGAHFGAITAWREGIITRGVLIDVPRHRGEPHATPERPVHGWEIEAIARAQNVEVTPGDALLVYSGKEAFTARGGTYGGGDRPGLSVTCAKFIRDHDVALLGWDMMDARPDPYGLAFPMHGVLFNYGVALLDNALLEPLADACAEEGRYEFLFMGLPLNVARGTGSPANPIAMF